MFLNAIILYGSSFWETAATQICGRPQGISLTSPLPAKVSDAIMNYDLFDQKVQKIEKLTVKVKTNKICPNGKTCLEFDQKEKLKQYENELFN